MKYLILEARRPQDGTPPLQALILLPKWMSSTLVCAGITGRITEMSDGNIVEEGNLYWAEDALRHDAKDAVAKTLETLPKVSPHPPSTEMPLMPTLPPAFAAELQNSRDEAYREGVQATRNTLTGAFVKLGMPEDASPIQWVTKQLEQLSETKQLLDTTQACLEAVQAPDEAAHLLTIGRLEKSVATLTQEVGNLADRPSRQQYDELKAHALDLVASLERLEGSEDGQMQAALDRRDDEIERLRTLLAGIRRMAKKGKK